MILRAKPNLLIVLFSDDKENKPKGDLHFHEDQSSQCPCAPYRAAGVGWGFGNINTDRPAFVGLER